VSPALVLPNKLCPLPCSVSLPCEVAALGWGPASQPTACAQARPHAHVQGGEATRMEEGEFFAIETFGSTGRQHSCVSESVTSLSSAKRKL
jgi:hypothetical protein